VRNVILKRPYFFASNGLQPQDEPQEPCFINFVDGIVIIVVVLLISAITAVNNYLQEIQFCNLQTKQDDSNVTVRRSGRATRIPIREVCVGDVVQLDTGAKIPAGCDPRPPHTKPRSRKRRSPSSSPPPQ
jgi:magnesium-transporting ATPase (P-type)